MFGTTTRIWAKINVMYKFTTKTGKEIIIRQPKISDLKAALEYVNRLAKERTFLTIGDKKKTLKEERKYLADVIENVRKKKGVHLMAFYGKMLVSGTGIDLKGDVRMHVGEYGIAVAKDFRGMGLGKLMTKLIIAEAKKNLSGLKIISLHVFSENKKAINMYRKFGFKECGKVPGGVLYRGQYIGDVLMYKKV